MISESKIKISLSKTDMDGYSISCDDIDYANTETRRVVWALLDDVRQKTGFDAAKSRIFVQIYPSRDGGCELYVSKLDKSEIKEKPSAKDSPPKWEYYIFDGIESVLSVCRALYIQGYAGDTRVYSDDIGRVFFCAERGTLSRTFMTEYAIPIDSETLPFYIKEHCSVLCPSDAVGVLGKL